MPSFTSQPNRDNDRARDDVDQALEQLLQDPGATLKVESLSDLSRPAAARLQERWTDIPPRRRADLVRAMLGDAEANVERNYERVMLIAANDEIGETRRMAIEALWECESETLLELLLQRVEREPDGDVRVALVVALGRFALLAEMEQIDAHSAKLVRKALLSRITSDPSPAVRRRSLESVAYFSGDQEVIEQIEQASRSDEHLMRVSALHAMGRQADERWLDLVHRQFGDDVPEIRFEAVTAAGMIGDQRSVPALIDMLTDEDVEVTLAAIQALGEIGGRLAVNTLRRLSEDDNPAVADAAADALEEASILGDPLRPVF